MHKFLFATVIAILMSVVGCKAGHAQILAQHEKTNQFKVGVLRTDGTLVPFAEYRHGLWWNPWAEVARAEGNNEIVPKSLGDQPEPWFKRCEGDSARWYFWSSADSPLVLEASGTLQVVNHSQTNWALMTDYPRKQKLNKGDHHSHAGMALDIDLKVDGMVEIERGSNESNSIVAHIKPGFSNAETAEVARTATSPVLKEFFAASGFPTSSEQRAKVELIPTKLYRTKSGIEGRHIYYIEVEKQYTKPARARDSSCDNVSFLKGWVLKGKDGSLALVNESFGLIDCDGKGKGSIVLLFSVMTVNNRTFLFAVEHGWEDESYTIYELKDFALTRLLETYGG